jgi:hypothetical protein
VNFYGHAWFAASERNDATFVLGAMLPDLAAMAGCRVRDAAEPALQGGLDHHVAVDAAFHTAPLFRRIVREAEVALGAAGVSRGTALAAAHVTPELLLDGWLAREYGTHEAYGQALGRSAALLGSVAWRSGDAVSVVEVCRRVAQADLPAGYARPEFAAARLARVLAGRPRLVVRAGDAAAVNGWVAELAPRVRELAPALLDQLREALAQRSGSSG